MSNVRYLPEKVTLTRDEDGYDERDYGWVPCRSVTYYPGLVDVSAFPDLLPYTVDAPPPQTAAMTS